MKCEQCKQEIDNNHKFCPHCGTAIQHRTQEEFSNALNKINNKIKLYKTLTTFVSILMLSIPIIFSSVLIGIIALVIILGVDIFLGTKIAKLNREKMLLERDYEVNKSTFSNVDVPISDQNDKSSYITTITHSLATNAEDNANRNIKRYILLNTIFLSIITVGLVFLGILLLFVPFISLIADNVSVYEVTKSSLLWNLGNEHNFTYSNVLVDILNNAPICSFLSKDVDTTLMFVGVSFTFLFMMPFVAVIAFIRNIYTTMKYNSNENFKHAVLYKYNSETRPSYVFGSILVIIVVTVLCSPALDYLFYLPTYFDGLVNEFYTVILICFTFTLVLMFVYPFILGLKYKENYKQAGFALKPDKR